MLSFWKKGTFKSTVYWRLPYFTELPCLFILYPDFLVELSFEAISNTAICNQSFCFNVRYVLLFILQGKSASEDHKSCRSPCIPSFKLPGNEHTYCQWLWNFGRESQITTILKQIKGIQWICVNRARNIANSASSVNNVVLACELK